MGPVIRVSQVDYPESDGKPMGETDDHRNQMIRHLELLEDYFRGQKVYVSGDLLVYYEQGNPRKYVVPDAFVAKGVMPGARRVYKIWVEGKSPDVVIETTSRKTRRKDTGEKAELYARLGVREYFLFDPHLEYLDPPLQGHRLSADAFQRIEPDSSGALASLELGLILRVADGQLQFERADNGERLLTRAERAEREAERAEREAERALREAERVVAEQLRAQTEAERAAREAERAQREAEARQRETERADREALARQAAEAEVARLRRELARRNPPSV